MTLLKLTGLELDATYDAVEHCIERVEEGRIWQNEDPQLLRALKRVLRKLGNVMAGTPL